VTEKLHGIVRGKIIELSEFVELPEGTEVEITITKKSYKDKWNRQIELMKRGFPMGQRRSVKRDEIYDRK
jgi:hypothetical protein